MNYIAKFLIVIGLSVSNSNFGAELSYPKIRVQNMASLEWEDQEWPNEDYYAYLMRCMCFQIYPQESQKRRIAFKILEQYERHYVNHIQQGQIDETTWHDINLFCGKEHKDIYLGSLVDHTQTQLGKVALYGVLAKPLINSQQLKQRQEIIRLLFNDEHMYQELRTILNKIAGAENAVLSFWGLWGNDPLSNSAQRHYFFFFLF